MQGKLQIRSTSESRMIRRTGYIAGGFIENI